MGRVKAEWMEWEEQAPMREWIEDNYGDDVSEGTPEWDEAAGEFEQYCQDQAKKAAAEYEQDQYDYYICLTSENAADIFSRDIRELKKMVDEVPALYDNPAFYKMAYTHGVSILEVYLEDTVKSLATSSEYHLNNTIHHVEPFKSETYSLSKISLEPDGIKKLVLTELSDQILTTTT